MPEPATPPAPTPHDDISISETNRSFASTAAFYIGSAGLIVATAADSIAVLGRHAGFAFIGAIEVVQAAIVFIAASSMVAVTLGRGHATVHILTERLQPRMRNILARLANLLSFVAVLLLVAGSVILLIDLWDGFERTELLHLPLRWFRILIIAGLLFVAILFAAQAFARRPDQGAEHGA